MTVPDNLKERYWRLTVEQRRVVVAQVKAATWEAIETGRLTPPQLRPLMCELLDTALKGFEG